MQNLVDSLLPLLWSREKKGLAHSVPFDMDSQGYKRLETVFRGGMDAKNNLRSFQDRSIYMIIIITKSNW